MAFRRAFWFTSKFFLCGKKQNQEENTNSFTDRPEPKNCRFENSIIVLQNSKDVEENFYNIFLLFLQPCPPPSPPTRRVRPMSVPSPSLLALASSGSSSSPTRVTVAKASKFHMSPMMVSQLIVTDFYTAINLYSTRLHVGTDLTCFLNFFIIFFFLLLSPHN